MVFKLIDVDERKCDGIIISDYSTEEEIQKAVDKAKKEDEWDLGTIEESLPSDCKLITDYDGLMEIYY